MKVTKINYSISCDVPGCGCLSAYSLTFDKSNQKIHLCASCAKKLKSALKGV